MLDFSKENLSIDDLLDYFSKNNCKNLTQASLMTLKENQARQLASVQRIPKHLRKDKENSNIQVLELSNKVLTIFIAHTTQFTTDLYSLLNTIHITESDSDTAKIINTLKLTALHELISLYKEQLSLEESPIALAIANEGAFDSSLQFAAFLIFLLEKNIQVDAIISSSLLHQYFELNFFNINSIKQCYFLLSVANTPQKELVVELLEKISFITTGQNLHVSYNLKGDQTEESNLKNIETSKPTYHWNFEKVDFEKIYMLLGPQFMINVICFFKNTKSESLEEIIRNTINSLSKENIAALYSYINTKVSDENDFRFNILTQLNHFINKELALSLLESKQVSIWSMLFSKTELIETLSSDYIEGLKDNLSISISEINPAIAISLMPQFNGIKDFIYLEVAKIYLKNHAIDWEEDILNELRTSLLVESWIKQESTQYKNALDQCIDENLNPFNQDSLINISDFMQLNKFQHRVLNRLSNTLLFLPENSHQCDAFSIERAYLKNALEFNQDILSNYLALMHPSEKYAYSLGANHTQEELNKTVIRAKTQVALESFACISNSKINQFFINHIEKDFLIEKINSNNVGAIYSNLLTMENNPDLYNLAISIKANLDTIITNGFDFGVALQYLNKQQRQILFDSVKDKLSTIIKDGSNFGYALYYLNEPQQQIVFDELKGSFGAIIKNSLDLSDALEYLNELQCKTLLNEIKDNLNTIIKDVSSLDDVLKYLNESHCKTLLNAIKNNLSTIINNGIHFGSALQSLSDSKRQVLLDSMKSNLSTIIKDGPNLGYALQYLNTLQCKVLLNAIKNNLSTIIKDGQNLGYALFYLNEPQRQIVFDSVKDNLNIIIKDGHNLGYALQYLNDTQRQIVFDSVKDNIRKLIKSGANLGYALYYLNERQRQIVFDSIKDKLGIIIRSADDLGIALKYLDESQCKTLLNAITDDNNHISNFRYINGSYRKIALRSLSTVKNKYSTIIKDAKNLSHTLKYLDESQCNTLLYAIQGNLSTIIKDDRDLCNALEFLNESQSKAVLNAIKENLSHIIRDGSSHYIVFKLLNKTQCKIVMDVIKDNISTIIKDGYSLGCALKYLDEAKKNILFNGIKDELTTMIKDGYSLRNALEHLNETQRQIVFDSIKDNLNIMINDSFSLGYALKYLNEAQRNIVIDKVKNKLSTIIENDDDFVNALQFLNDAQCKRVLDTIKDKLSTIIKDEYALSRTLKDLNEVQITSLFDNRTFMLTVMQFDKSYLNNGSKVLKNDLSLKTASYIPFMASALLYPEASQSILLGLTISIVVIATVMTCGLSLIPSAAIAVSSGALTGVGFFAIKTSNNIQDEVKTEDLEQSIIEI